MEHVSDVRSKQRAVIEFLLTENKSRESIVNIHKPLTNVYGNMAVDKSSRYQPLGEAIRIIRTRTGQSV
jgi:hypothetical protein